MSFLGKLMGVGKKVGNKIINRIKAHIRRAILLNPPVLIAIVITVLLVIIFLVIIGMFSSEEYNAASIDEGDNEYVEVDANDFCVHTERSDPKLVLTSSQMQRAINNLNWR